MNNHKFKNSFFIECKLYKPQNKLNAYATTKDLAQQTDRLLSHTICKGPKESTSRKQILHGFTDWFEPSLVADM